METAKQKAIREAYGEHWEELKNRIDENGWYNWFESEINVNIDDLDFECSKDGFKIIPKSLKGIEEYFTFEEIIGFEFYEVNKLGLVKSKERISIQKNGKKYLVNEKILKPNVDSHGYIVFGLRKDGKTKKVYLHRILTELFIPNPENKPTVNHKDGVKYNNNLSNLEWATYLENNKHAFEIGLQKKGEEHHMYGKKGDECHNYRKRNKKVIHNGIQYNCIEDLAKELKLTVGYLYQCITNKVPNIHNIKYLENQPIKEPEPPIY